ncbi:MAG: serine/threonine-protein phosphatase [Rhodobacteraceae bacterium]|nr:serine/threonine-protein phosphatase [Paracoccaceae bacterium]
MPEFEVEYAMFTHRGKVRAHNEDSIVAGKRIECGPMPDPMRVVQDSDWPLLLAVADGLGGLAAGEIASRLAVTSLSKSEFKNIDGFGLEEALAHAHKEILDHSIRKPYQRGMATTVAGTMIHPDRCSWFNIGDSRVYQRTQEGLTQLSEDDVPVSDGLYGRSHIVTQVLGGTPLQARPQAHVGSASVSMGDRLLICSDGLTDMLSDSEINASFQDTCANTVKELFNRAMDAGGVDNISVIVAAVGGN